MGKTVIFTDETFIKRIETQQKDSEDFADTIQRLCEERLNVYTGAYNLTLENEGIQ